MNKPVDTKQVRDFLGKLTKRPAAVVGLIVSMSGFTTHAREEVGARSHERLILTADRRDLEHMLRGEPEVPDWFAETLRRRLEHPNQLV